MSSEKDILIEEIKQLNETIDKLMSIPSKVRGEAESFSFLSATALLSATFGSLLGAGGVVIATVIPALANPVGIIALGGLLMATGLAGPPAYLRSKNAKIERELAALDQNISSIIRRFENLKNSGLLDEKNIDEFKSLISLINAKHSRLLISDENEDELRRAQQIKQDVSQDLTRRQIPVEPVRRTL